MGIFCSKIIDDGESAACASSEGGDLVGDDAGDVRVDAPARYFLSNSNCCSIEVSKNVDICD